MSGLSRIGTSELQSLCRRLSIVLEAGIDLRTAISREAERTARAATAARLRAVRDAIQQGDSLRNAFARTDQYFPPLFHAIVDVGEQSGHLGEALRQLADYYENQLRLRRQFLGAIALPLAELGIGIAVIGILIWALGAIEQFTGRRVDVLGFGLVGYRGLVIYLTAVAAGALSIFGIVQGFRRGLAWAKPLQRLVLRLPAIGKPLTTLALARLAWAMQLTLDAGMDVRKALRLSLQSTHHAHFTDQIGAVERAIDAGESFYEAFAQTDAFPREFVESLRVAEESGSLVESMAKLSRQYQEQAEAALRVLTTLAGLGVWMLIAAIFVATIFRLFSFYIGTIGGFASRG